MAANISYRGSLAHMRMRFTSELDVRVNNQEELFNAQSIYIPKKYAAKNIIGWDEGWLKNGRPAVIAASVENYKTIMQEDLLKQWGRVFRQDTNGSVVLYLIIFDDTKDSTGWKITANTVEYAPLSEAFAALNNFSYFKHMFDPTSFGGTSGQEDVPGWPPKMGFRFRNNAGYGKEASMGLALRNTNQGDPGSAATTGLSMRNTAQAVEGEKARMRTRLWFANGFEGTIVPAGTVLTLGYSTALGKEYETTLAVDMEIGSQGLNTVLEWEAKEEGFDSRLQPVVLPLDQIFLPAEVKQCFSSVEVETIHSRGVDAEDGHRTLATGNYSFTFGNKRFDGTLAAETDVAFGETFTFPGRFTANSVGFVQNLTDGTTVPLTAFDPASSVVPDSAFAVTLNSPENGTEAEGADVPLNPGVYVLDYQGAQWKFTLPAGIILPTDGVYNAGAEALLRGEVQGVVVGAVIDPSAYTEGEIPPAGVVTEVTSFTQGVNDGKVFTVPAGTYNFRVPQGNMLYTFSLAADKQVLPGSMSDPVTMTGTSRDEDAFLADAVYSEEGVTYLREEYFSPGLPEGALAEFLSFEQGKKDEGGQVTVDSRYFDLSLALAILCRDDPALSWMWSMVRIKYNPDTNDISNENNCLIRNLTRSQQLDACKFGGDLALPANEADRAKYYWACLYLLGCANTTVLVHSEDMNIVPLVLTGWFARRNESGTFIGNALSLQRISEELVKPLGYPSWLDSSVNENDTGYLQDGANRIHAHDHFRQLNVGHLLTISDRSITDVYLTMARGVGDPEKGVPVSMQMISKFVDYTCSMDMANLISDKGRLTDPLMADETAYGIIQNIVYRNLMRFSGNGALTNIALTFPDFSEARKSATWISAATAWSGLYQDQLDRVEVSGSLVAE